MKAIGIAALPVTVSCCEHSFQVRRQLTDLVRLLPGFPTILIICGRQVKNTDYITTHCALIDQNWSGMNFNEPKSTSTEANSLRQLIRMREMEREFRACKQMLTDLMSLSHGGGGEGGGKWATSLLL